MNVTLSHLPNAVNTANRLENKPEALKKEKQQIEFNVGLLKENIKACREKVNQ